MDFLDPVFLIGMGASFFCGAFGYIIIQFWIRPISRYRKIKDQAALDLKLNDTDLTQKRMEEIREAAKKYSVSLSDSYSLDVPPWYRMILDNRGESPVEASKHFMKLSNTRDEAHFRERAEKIRQALHFK